MKRFLITFSLIVATMLSLSAQTLTCSNGTSQRMSTVNGYDYELWSENGQGTASLTINASATNGGAFTCSWQNTKNVLSRSGKKFKNNETVSSVGNITIDFEATWSSSDNVKMLGVYGWGYFAQGQIPSGFSDQIEYYIIQDRGSYNSAKSGTNSTKKGEATIDGILYEFYVCDRVNQPMLTGNGTFKQYFSVPKNTGDHRTKGLISVSKHFAEWAKVGMTMNKLYEVAMKVESYTGTASGARGEANVTKNILTIGGEEGFTLNATASPEQGGTITKTPNSASYTAGTSVQLTAVPAQGWIFDGWSGDATGRQSPLTVTMTESKNITAKFIPTADCTTNSVMDGNFPGTALTSNWTLNYGQYYGNSAASSSVSGGKVTINITTAGEENYQPQLIQKSIALDEGIKYRLTFDASAAAARSMNVMLQESSGSYTMYASKDFNLTTTQQTFMLEFEMKNPSDLATQLSFNVGGTGATQSVTISNVKLICIASMTPPALTLDAQGGSVTQSSIPVEPGTTIGELPTPVREGYTFGGWFSQANGAGTQYLPTSTLPDNATAFAKWTATPYTITYNVNGGSEILDETYTIESEPVTLKSTTKAGYDFGGWYEKPDFSGEVVTVLPSGSMDNKQYYAKWDIINYDIVYILDEGDNHPDNPLTYTIEDHIILQEPAKSDYTFDGWAEGNEIPTGSTGEKTFTAIWAFSISIPDIISSSVNELQVYLDPATDGKLNVVLKGNETAAFTIFNMQGQPVFNTIIKEGLTSISTNLEAGAYIVSVQLGSGLKTQKLIIK